MGNMELESMGKNAAWEELGIANDFLFGKIMQDAGLCRNCFKEYSRIWRLTA